MGESFSMRGAVARNLADTVIFGGLIDTLGDGHVVKTESKSDSHWDIPFSRAGQRGIIQVYGPRSIRVEHGRSKQQFNHETDVKDFLITRFINP